ncbi:antibiotic biosynthesis monooxygenase family protein [Ferrimonas balearica]|uniref:antibiotic biosynthesis monooxygenase family protein n=1 Tax=Ferrimonas balearica TaxID=44012 RepID=UPI001C99E1CC|nr:antibiotic biosynthesis monooxygenase [Ferrimonas balearica]MBY5991386.1 antibiotic biosynthesis monooxygenase [Ferrimonas balearica]
MYVVIFRARVAQLDARYSDLAGQLRQRALDEFGCREFVAVTEGQEEIALSYWDSQADILAWKADSEHRVAQSLGRDQWYQHYSVEIAQIERAYGTRPA